jgi:potassium efflux system protein
MVLVWTLIAALPLPVILFLLGAYLQDVGSPGAIGHSIGLAASLLVMPLYAALVLYWTAREGGLGERHFRWSAARCGALRRIIPVTLGVVMPMVFLAALAMARGLELSSDVLARLAIIVASLELAGSLWYAMGPNRLWERQGARVEPAPLRKLLRVTLTLTVASVAWFALQGFVYSASRFLFDILYTFSVLVAISLLVGLIGRWLLLGERRLAANREEGTAPLVVISTDPDAEPVVEPELSLEQVNAQTGRLLAALRIALIIGTVLWVWSEALPAFTRLEEVVLWRVTGVGVDGQSESQAITLLALLAGIVTLMITVAGARNLPGLIEIVLANYTKVDAPSRYAVTSLLRYAIVITGTLLVLALLGMQWARLQWLAAGLTVGLGFGLQEIFANFISGLILLFERPFRVGDIVTVEGLSGRVTRIRTRATTILDFDNREIVLPNKNFITGQLVNWTLSDTTTRLTVSVGVAYGTAPQQVHELLRRAAREHPLVLRDPEPVSWFLDFGPSALNFSLMLFVASPRDRFPVQDALNTRIAELFAEHGIEIAFPQMDVHLRTLPAGQAVPPPTG